MQTTQFQITGICVWAIMSICSLQLNAQDQTRTMGQGFQLNKGARITVVPFEPRMIVSDLHREMCMKNGMTSKQLHQEIAAAFCYAMRNTSPELLEADVIGWEDAWPTGLEKIYSELGYRNTPVEDYVGGGGTTVEEGQLRTRYDTLTRYMRPVLKAPLIASLVEETSTDFVLMITQIDLVNLGESARIAPDASQYYVRIHYALFNPEGELVKGGLTSTKLETDSYIPAEIAKNEFKVLAGLLYSDVVGFLNVSQAAEGEESTGKD